MRARTAVLLSAAVFLLPLAFVLLIPDPLEQPIGVDFVLYRDVAARWLGGGPYFEPYQIAGPYEIRAGDVLYPPIGLLLFVPFAVVPAAIAWGLWWGLPLGATAFAAWRLRPRPPVWPLMALCVAWPTTLLKTWTGNPVIWCVAAWPGNALVLAVGLRAAEAEPCAIRPVWGAAPVVVSPWRSSRPRPSPSARCGPTGSPRS